MYDSHRKGNATRDQMMRQYLLDDSRQINQIFVKSLNDWTSCDLID